MKSKATRKSTAPVIEFPRLMESASDGVDYVILAIGQSGHTLTGVVVHAGNKSPWPLGEYSTKWDAKCFRPFQGEIQLSDV